MISFQSDNLDYRIYKVDDFDISLHMNSEKLDHIFKEYLYFTLSEMIGDDGQVAFNYELRTDKLDDLYKDEVLGSVLIFWLSYHYILDILNMSKIQLISSVNHPNFVHLYFNQKITDSTYGILANYNKGTEFYTDHIFGLRNLKYSTYDVQEQSRSWFMTNEKTEFTKYLGNNITIITENFITDLDKEQAMDNIFGAYTGTGNDVTIILKEDIKSALRFGFTLTMNGLEYTIIFSTNQNNYIIANRLKELFKLMDTRVNNVIWKWKEISYLYVEDTDFVTDYIDPEFKEGNIIVANSYVDTWVKNKYNAGSTVFNQQPTFDNAVFDILDDIKMFVDEIGKGIVYFDFDNTMLHTTIGNQDDYSFLDIYGYDEERQRPILLGINKDYESAGSQFRSIKVISGGITAINNDELVNDMTSADYEYLMQTTLVDVKHIHYMDMFAMIADVYGFTPRTPTAFQLFNPVDSDRKFFYNDGEYDAKGKTIDAQVYKQSKPYDQTTTESLYVFTMKTFIIEPLSNWNGDSSQGKIRDIEFRLKGEKVEIPYEQITDFGYDDIRPIIVNSYKTGCQTSSSNYFNSYNNMRSGIHFDPPIQFDQLIINNYHCNGGDSNFGIANCRFLIADFKFEADGFEESSHLLDLIFEGEIREHIPSNTADDIIIPLTIPASITDNTSVPMFTLLDVASFGLDQTDTNSCAIPYDAIISLFNDVTDEGSMLEFIHEWFQIDGDSNEISFDAVEYNNLFIKYVPIVSGNGMFHISHRNSVVGYRTINDRLLHALSLDVKKDILEDLWNDTDNMVKYKCLIGTDVITQINDDSEFNTNVNWSRDIFTNGVELKELHTLSNSTKSEFLSMLMNENMYHSAIELFSGRYICALFKLEDVIQNSYNNSIIFNKVIGSDQYSYYSLKSTGNDITFSGYFISSYTDNHYAWWLLDLDNGKIKNIATTPFEFNAGTTNPIITNLEVIENRELYVVDKADYDTIYNNWLNVFKIYDILPVYQIVYARKPFDITKNQIFNVYANEYTLVSEV